MCIIHLRKYSSFHIKIKSTRKLKKMLKSDKSEPKKILVAKEKRLDQITKKKILVAKEKRLDQITKKARIIKY